MVFIHSIIMFALGVFLLEAGWEALISGHFSELPFSRLLTFPFILACVPYLSSTCRIDFSKADTCPISPYPKWLGGGCKSWRVWLCQVQSIEWQ